MRAELCSRRTACAAICGWRNSTRPKPRGWPAASTGTFERSSTASCSWKPRVKCSWSICHPTLGARLPTYTRKPPRLLTSAVSSRRITCNGCETAGRFGRSAGLSRHGAAPAGREAAGGRSGAHSQLPPRPRAQRCRSRAAGRSRREAPANSPGALARWRDGVGVTARDGRCTCTWRTSPRGARSS